jgi:hypothetical protein
MSMALKVEHFVTPSIAFSAFGSVLNGLNPPECEAKTPETASDLSAGAQAKTKGIKAKIKT